MKTLVLNSGSSSIKYCLFEMNQHSVIASGMVEKIGEADSLHQFEMAGNSNPVQKNTLPIADHQQGLQAIFGILTDSGAIKNAQELFCMGHRVVHGGEHFRQPVIIDNNVINKIRDLIPLAPLHNPANLLGIEQAIKQLASVPQVAVFDTAFHQSLPAHAYHYAVPKTWYEENSVRRYGFHGTSHYYVAKQAAEYLGKPVQSLNLITLHLGNGGSVTAIQQGKSIDTSMGMTPLEGLMMGTRCGDIDPAIHFYLSRVKKLSNTEIETLLNKNSGLKGICGENDMRAVHKLADAGDEDAQLALQMYVYRIKKYLGAYYAVLGHVDAIVFTGGIGENDAWLREQCCTNLTALDIAVDIKKNNTINGHCCDISSNNPSVAVLVIKTNEELEIALQSVECVSNTQ
jgi:acetate kinase